MRARATVPAIARGASAPARPRCQRAPLTCLCGSIFRAALRFDADNSGIIEYDELDKSLKHLPPERPSGSGERPSSSGGGESGGAGGSSAGLADENARLKAENDELKHELEKLRTAAAAGGGEPATKRASPERSGQAQNRHNRARSRS